MNVLVTGGTGYIGTRLISALTMRGHSVRALVRPGSAHRLPEHVVTVAGNALNAASISSVAETADTLVHLVGTPHPNPSKAEEFRRVDLESIRASVAAAKERRIAHLVYVSVAHPAPAMQAYVAARIEGEAAIAEDRAGVDNAAPRREVSPTLARYAASRLAQIVLVSTTPLRGVKSPPHSRATPLRGSPKSCWCRQRRSAA